MLLGCCTDVERRNVHKLVAHTDVALTDKDTGVVDALGETLLVHLGLEASLQQLLCGELKDEIKLELVIGQQTIPAHATEEGSSLEDTFGILGVKRQQGTGGLTKLGKSVLDTPDLALAPKPVLSHELQFGIKTFLLVRTTGSLEGLAVCANQEKQDKEEAGSVSVSVGVGVKRKRYDGAGSNGKSTKTIIIARTVPNRSWRRCSAGRRCESPSGC